MGYKSKKINKRRYFKRQSRKVIKRGMYGGESQDISTQITNNNKQPSSQKPLSQEPKMTTNNNQQPSSQDKPHPTIMSNLGKVVNLAVDFGNNVVSKGIDYVGDATGYDPNKPSSESIEKAKIKMQNLSKVLSNPEFQSAASDVAEELVETLQPAAEKGLDVANKLLEKEIPIAGNMLNEAALMIPGAGQVIGSIEELGNVAQAVEAATESFADLATVGAETTKDLEEKKGEIESLWNKGSELLSDVSQGVNNTVSNVIDSAQESVSKEGENLMKSVPPVSDFNNNNLNPIVNKQNKELKTVGGSLKKYQKEKMMIGGRISQSQSEFLGGQLFSSQNSQQNGGKWNTKRRHYLKRKMTSRSYK